MTNKGGKSLAMARIVASMTLILCTHAAQAQSVSDYRLPEPTASPTPRAAGPIDPENPGASTPRAISTREPAPATRATAATAGSPAPTPRTSALPTATPGRAAPRAVPRIFPRPATAAAPSGPIIATPDAAVSDVLPTGTAYGPAPSFPSLEPSPAPAPDPAPDAAIGWWPYLAAGSAALAGLFALLWWRRRGAIRETVVEFEMPVVAAPLPVSEPVPVQPIPEPEQAVAPQPDGLVLTLEATRLSASLMATTLSYRLKLTNHGTIALAGLAIEGDMVSAHASLPPEKQMAQAGQALELRHALTALAPGESAEFSGDIRLPLTEITPIRAGELAYFVPLARFRVEAGTPDGVPFILARTYVVGDVPEGPQTTLRPFRLDLGPRTYSRVSQREVN